MKEDSLMANKEINKWRRIEFKAPFMFLCILLISFTVMSCGREKKAEVERIVNIATWSVEKRNVQPYLETTGTLRADEEVIVSSEVDGIVRKLYVDEGTSVRTGMLLAEINETDYALDVKRADAALKQVQAQFGNAKTEYQRKKALFEEELITKQQFDDISTRVALAEAELERAKATLAISRERLSRTKIYSPLSGFVKEKRVSAGDFVRASMPIIQIIKINPLKLNFTVTEKDVAGLKKGQEVAFAVDAFPGKTFKGKVNLLYPNVEERTRSLQAEASVPNADGMLKPGYFARIRIFTEAPRNAEVVPITALLNDENNVRVFVVNGSVAKERVIKTGRKYGEYMEVLEGLKEKEQVVVVGQNNLSEGVKVHVAR